MSDDATLDEFGKKESDSLEPEAEKLTRKTVCGIPPQSWTVARLGELVSVVSGNSLPTEYQNGSNGEYPVYKISDMNAIGNQKYVSESSNWLFEEELEELNHTLYREGTTILPKVGAALLTNKRRVLTEPSSFDNNVMGWIPDEINPEFLYYVSCMIDMRAVAQQGAVPSISKGIAKSLKLPSPPLSEQRKIATVLHTVDQAIQKTEEIIEQITRVSAGTAQNLFRSGISEGKTKETWLGGIPADWEVIKFSEIVDSSRNGLYKSKDAYGEGYPIAKMGNALEKRTLDMSSTDRLELTNEEKQKYGLNEGDLIFARRAQEVSAAGDCCYVAQLEETTVFESSLIRVRLSDKADPRFYTQYFDSPVGSRSIDRIVTETSISGIATSDLLDLKVALPSLAEQNKIASIMWEFDKAKKKSKQEKNQLERVKRGLMQDLLSGEVRTTDVDIDIPEEVAKYG